MKVMDEIAGSGAGAGSIGQRHGSADPDPTKLLPTTDQWIHSSVYDIVINTKSAFFQNRTWVYLYSVISWH
jgi:hypothetical protein